MRKTVCLLAMFAVSVTAVRAGGFLDLNAIRASDVKAAADIAVPVPSAPAKEDPAPPDLVNKFNNAANELRIMRNDLTWVKNDLDNLNNTAQRMIQTNSQDAFFPSDLRKMSTDMSRRVNDIRRIASDVKELLGLAQKSKQLNDIARKMDQDARMILYDAWPGMEDASQNLEGTIRSGRPELFGYDAEWTASDISRNCRDFSYQARHTYSDTESLVKNTQP
ncbi:MAG: hypothetical protein NTX59_11345 [Elusimicrobia bacterium]|nr:hypothetical protein [Elusimicrobiota bacterium]